MVGIYFPVHMGMESSALGTGSHPVLSLHSFGGSFGGVYCYEVGTGSVSIVVKIIFSRELLVNILFSGKLLVNILFLCIWLVAW